MTRLLSVYNICLWHVQLHISFGCIYDHCVLVKIKSQAMSKAVGMKIYILYMNCYLKTKDKVILEEGERESQGG